MGGIYWLASYPKSGNTWFRAFLHNLQRDGDVPVDINIDMHSSAIASSRSWLDDVLGFDTADLSEDEIEHLRPAVYRWSARETSINYHKIHDAYTHADANEPLVSRAATIGALYILRNPLDVAASLASHTRCSIDQAIQFMGNPAAAVYLSRTTAHRQVRQRLGTWSTHVLSWVDAPVLNRHIIRYEDMLDQPTEVFSRAADFLELPTEQARTAKAIQHCAFDNLASQEARSGFREKPAGVERFFRRGQCGGWRKELTAEQVARVVADHGVVMRRFGYLDRHGAPR